MTAETDLLPLPEGQNPEEVCCDYFGLEPDYIWELL